MRWSILAGIGLYVVLVALGVFAISGRNHVPTDYTAARRLVHNHRIGEADIKPPPLALRGLGLGVDDPNTFVGRYVLATIAPSQPVRLDNLSSGPQLRSRPGYVSYWHALQNEPPSLPSILDANDSVDVCVFAGGCVANVKVEAVACGKTPQSCDAILQLPIKYLAGLVRTKGDSGITIYLR